MVSQKKRRLRPVESSVLEEANLTRSVTSVTQQKQGGISFKLLALIDEDLTRTFTAKQIARLLSHSYPATRVLLSRLHKAGRVRRVTFGVYQSLRSLVRPGLPDPNLRLHALKVESCYSRQGRPFRQVLQRVSTVWPSPDRRRHSINGSISTRHDWEGRFLTITVHPEKSGLVEIFLQSSDRPLSLVEAYAYLSGTIVTGTGIPSELWMITQADWNIDVRGELQSGLGLVGLSVAGFGRLILKIYQKAAEQIRTEVRSFEPLGAAELIAYCRSILQTLEDVKNVQTREGGQVP